MCLSISTAIQSELILDLGSGFCPFIPGNRWHGEGTVEQVKKGARQKRDPKASLLHVGLPDLLSDLLRLQVYWLFDSP